MIENVVQNFRSFRGRGEGEARPSNMRKHNQKVPEAVTDWKWGNM